MSGTWPTARAQIQAELSGLTVTVSGMATETLLALEYAPGGRQDLINWPYAFILPTGETVTREPGGQRITTKSASVRVMLSPVGEDSMENLQKRYDAWKEALKDAFDDAVALNGAADIFLTQEFAALARFDDLDTGWGFDMGLGDIQISETKTFGP